MDKQRAVLFGLLLLAALAALALSYRFAGGGPVTPESGPESNASGLDENETAYADALKFWQEGAAVLARIRETSWTTTYRTPARNPMTAPPPKPVREPIISIIREQVPRKELRLTGILAGREKNSALINGEIVQAGDMIEGRRILAVETALVVLREEDQAETILRLPE